MIRALSAAAVLLFLAPSLPAPFIPRATAWNPDAAAAQREDDDRFSVGVLRRDGVLIPFAAFDGRWSSPWPSAVRGLELPITLDDVPERWWGRTPPPSEMIAWADGNRLGAVRLEKPAAMPVMCVPRIALRSDYKSKEPPAPLLAQPFPKDGLVTTGGPAVQPLRAVDPQSSDWSAAAVTILEAFNNAEERAARDFTSWRHPYSRAARERMTIQLEALYRAPMDEPGWSAYYVEAVRRYAPAPGDDGCGLVTFTSGWVRIGPNGKALLDLASRITYCDRKGASYMLPLGLMTVEGKTYWIFQMSGYDREWYVIARPAPRAIEIHVDYPAGSCPSV